MKDKRTIYILLPAVVVIWVVIAYQIFKALDNSNNYNTSISTMSGHWPDTTQQEIFYALLLDYEDPFLGKVKTRTPIATPVVQKQVSPPVKQQQTLQKANPENTFNWGAIRYLGVVENAVSDAKVALLEVNGESCFLKEGEKVSDIYVKNIAVDFIIVQVNNIEKSIRKTQ